MSTTSSTRFWVGIDVSKTKLDVGFFPQSESWSFANDADGIQTLLERLRDGSPQLIVCEATGQLEVPLVGELAAAGLPIAVVNPRPVRDYAKALGILAKTDRLDADVLARFAHDVQPPIRAFPTEKQRQFGDLAARRRQLIGIRTMELNRSHQARDAAIRASIQSVLDCLQQQIDGIERQLRTALEGDPAARHNDELLQSAKGVADNVSGTLLADLPELGTVSNKQIASLVGLAPFNDDSGKHRGKRSVRGGRTVRAALYMAVLSARRFNPIIKDFYDRLVQRGKPFKVVMTACMHKLLTILNAILRHQTPWRNQPQHLSVP